MASSILLVGNIQNLKLPEQCSLTTVGHGDKIAADLEKFDLVYLDTVQNQVLNRIFQVLKKGGELRICRKTHEYTQQTDSDLTLSGFQDIAISESYLVAKKPAWSGTVFSLKSKQQQQAPIDKAAALQAWATPTTATTNDNDDMLDANDLLQPEDLLVKQVDTSSCRTTKKKPCKNCSCGWADEVSKTAVTLDLNGTTQPKSACGSCYLGDAFRCSDCPYLGLPAFKPGEKVSVSSKLMQSDI